MLRVAESFDLSDTGRQRRANEDSRFARAPLFVVADGMGGAQAGEIASRLAVEAFEPGLADQGGLSPEQGLRERVTEANERIHALAQRDRARQGMGTTVTAAAVGEHDVAVAHVGDSRAYRLREGVFERLTEDHSLVEELMRQGKLTPEEASAHPQRSIITRALGPEPEVQVDSHTWPAEPGDVYLLCSDGLTSMVSEGEIGELLRDAGSLKEAGRGLVAAANEAGGRDNVTVVLFRLEAVGAAPAEGATAEHDATPTGEEPTMVGARPGAEDLTADAVRSAVADDEAARARRIEPRAAGQEEAGEPARRSPLRRTLVALIVTALIAVPVAIAAWLAAGSVYFVGASEDGFVAVYRGLPYDLPLGMDLYGESYVSGVPVRSLPRARRVTLLDHTLRSRDDAADLMRTLETGELGAR
ncbi:MAG TPA: Stp1/IreP family PP2C-type Ser/Thr phosphatase [Solirubrobacteraceae bacterium]|nr:Stp1/IreP family PP2C-type Ser/Thr phosphatase [Solirubrobacteraceae bacterium]